MPRRGAEILLQVEAGTKEDGTLPSKESGASVVPITPSSFDKPTNREWPGLGGVIGTTGVNIMVHMVSHGRG